MNIRMRYVSYLEFLMLLKIMSITISGLETNVLANYGNTSSSLRHNSEPRVVVLPGPVAVRVSGASQFLVASPPQRTASCRQFPDFIEWRISGEIGGLPSPPGPRCTPVNEGKTLINGFISKLISARRICVIF